MRVRRIRSTQLKTEKHRINLRKLACHLKKHQFRSRNKQARSCLDYGATRKRRSIHVPHHPGCSSGVLIGGHKKMDRSLENELQRCLSKRLLGIRYRCAIYLSGSRRRHYMRVALVTRPQIFESRLMTEANRHRLHTLKRLNCRACATGFMAPKSVARFFGDALCHNQQRGFPQGNTKFDGSANQATAALLSELTRVGQLQRLKQETAPSKRCRTWHRAKTG